MQQCEAAHPLPRKRQQASCNGFDDTVAVHGLHQRIVQRENWLKAARSPLTTRPARKLSVDSSRIVTFRHDYMQAPEIRGIISDVDIRSSPAHVGRDRDAAALSGLCHDLCFPPTLLGVQQLEWYPHFGEVSGRGLGRGDGSRSEQDRRAKFVETLNGFDDDTPLRISGRHDSGPMQEKASRTMQGNLCNGEPIDAPQFSRSLTRGAGHSRKASVSSKETLICHARKRGPRSRHRASLFQLHHLVNAFAPEPIRHGSASVLINDFDLSVPDNILFVLAV